MPIRPSEKARYPKNWKEISLRIRKRSHGRCECLGECGRQHTVGIKNARCWEWNGDKAKAFKGKVVLTVAHLNHKPEDCRNKNLKAMCQRCHLRYDSKHHQKNAKATRERKKGPMFQGLDKK